MNPLDWQILQELLFNSMHCIKLTHCCVKIIVKLLLRGKYIKDRCGFSEKTNHLKLGLQQ